HRAPGKPTWVSRSVQAFMVVAGDLRQPPEAVGLVEDPHGQIGMQSDPLELARGQRPWLGPYLIRHPDAPQVVNVARTSCQGRGAGVDTGRESRRAGEPSHRARMPKGERALEVDEVSECD